ncbi:hypothetical protein GsuE55_10520 [Geobacillus subterraneus]|uniref:Uncharacterized protein n=1 Tax=Geobacillus subterraneus TaxID=129338 RepID=A0A679FMN4_9BACL|nr:hypothetical protein GsuE55_10520 [Geobacillus subterraneus]
MCSPEGKINARDQSDKSILIKTNGSDQRGAVHFLSSGDSSRNHFLPHCAHRNNIKKIKYHENVNKKYVDNI